MESCTSQTEVHGILTTVAGTGYPGYDSEVGNATMIKLQQPNGVAVTADGGSLIICDSKNHLIRKVNLTTGQISTIAGINGTGEYNGDNIPARNATLNYPTDLHVAPSGNLYFLDENNIRIRKIDREGIITTVAGNGQSGSATYGLLANETSIQGLKGFCVSKEEELFITGYLTVVKMVDKEGIIWRVAGIPDHGGFEDNVPALKANVNNPKGCAVTDTNEIIITDYYNYRVRKFTVGGNMTTIAGSGSSSMGRGSGIAFNVP